MLLPEISINVTGIKYTVMKLQKWIWECIKRKPQSYFRGVFFWSKVAMK